MEKANFLWFVLGMHTEAAQTYLATLQRNPTISHVWDYLKMTINSLSILPPHVIDTMIQCREVESFRPYFDF
jgi:hypothetical protein